MWSKTEDLNAWSKVESFQSVVLKIEEMASKKKQDEKNFKLLREIVSLPCNKHCFDCQQRGPTYVNMTIGSFVCTTCSGLLRGLTPPHRVKSISMASFSDEEILLLKSRGNEYCRRVWLGLYDPAQVTDVSDESHVKDFMINKYERKRFYLDPSKVTLPSTQMKPILSQPSTPQNSTPKHQSMAVPRNTPTLNVSSNINNNRKQTDPFSPVTATPVVNVADNFANFDNAPIFNAATATPVKQQTLSCASQDLSFLASAFSTPPVQYQQQYQQQAQVQQVFTPNHNVSWFNPWATDSWYVAPSTSTPSPAMSVNNSTPAQDRYAALKDLDSMMRATTASPWTTNGASSVFDTPQSQPPASQLAGSPASVFHTPDSSMSSPGNPFITSPPSNNNPWGNATPPSFSQSAAYPRTNPFEAATTNGVHTNNLGNNQVQGDLAWAANFQDTSFNSPFNQVSNFAAPAENSNKGWNFVGNNFNNPFTLGNGGSAKSSNPFL